MSPKVRRIGLAFFLSLVAVGVALQLYLMEWQNPGLRGDLCTAQEAEMEHSPLHGPSPSPGGAP